MAGYPVLLVRNKKEFRALGSKCPHHGAPLSKGNPGSGQGGEAVSGRSALITQLWGGFSIAGVLKRERLRCPWHGACFNIKTGDIEEYPSLDCLPCFKVTSCLFLLPAWAMSCIPLAFIHSHKLFVPDTN